MIDDQFNLERFVIAQEKYYKTALNELIAGQKQSHWIWFIFPQIEGLGESEISRRFSIESLEEADAYLNHPVLGTRLYECVQAVLDIKDHTVTEIFGQLDAKKFLSSLTLFNEVKNVSPIFEQAIDQCFYGVKDQKTLALL